jgi:alpha-L-fucosidase
LPPEENRRILEAVRAAGPEVVVNGRLVANYGDYKNTADRPAEIPYTDGHWEGIPTTNESYGWSRIDHSHKPPEHFIVLLAKTVSKGGNMLLNIGPMGTGEIDPKDVSILNGIGTWMKKNGESIYGCDRTPLAVQAWGTSTRKGNMLYLHVFKWPTDGKLRVAGLKTDPVGAHLLADAGAHLDVHRENPLDVILSLPAAAPDATDSVISLDFNSPPDTDFARYISRSETTSLHVMDGRLAGSGIRYGDGKRNNDCTLEWTGESSGVDWPVRVAVAGRYRINMNYSTSTSDARGAFAISAEGKTVKSELRATARANAFQTVSAGEIELPAGETILRVRPAGFSGSELMRLRLLELTPVK